MLLTETQAAKMLQVDRRTVRKLICSERLHAVDVGGGKRRVFRIDPADLRSISRAGSAWVRAADCVSSSARRHLPSTVSVSSYLPNA